MQREKKLPKGVPFDSFQAQYSMTLFSADVNSFGGFVAQTFTHNDIDFPKFGDGGLLSKGTLFDKSRERDVIQMKNKIKHFQRMVALFLSAVLASSLLYIPAFAVDINDSSVFIKQTTNSTCTLASAAMMLRRHAILDGVGDWNTITESTVQSSAWVNGSGMRWTFSYRGMNVATQSITSAGYTTVSAKKDYFISMLRSHPEGIVIYAHSVPNAKSHAVLLTDYDSNTGIFYCGDPSGSSRGRTQLASSTLPGSSQDGKIENIKQIWYVKSGTATGRAPQPSATPLPSNFTISIEKSNYTLGETVTITPSANDTTHYAVTIWLGVFGSGERVYHQDYIPLNDKVRFIPTQAGTYTIHMDAINSAGYIEGEQTFTVSQPHTTHTWDGGVITKQPTFDSTGTRTYTCTVCKETKTETLERLECETYRSSNSTLQATLTRDGHMTVTGVPGELTWVTHLDADHAGYQMMNDRDLVTSLSIEEGITRIDASSFGGFRNLRTIELPQSLTSIEIMAFDDCTSLREINIPQNVSSLSINVFSGCTSLEKISVSNQNTHYCSIDNVVYTKDMTELVCCAPGRDGNVVIPEGVSKIDSAAFFDCGKLSSVTVPRSVISIASVSTFGAPDGNYVDKPLFNAVLRVYSGSYAENYAKQHSLKYEVINECANGHTWDNGRVTTEATTTSSGVRTYTCTVCKTIRTETIPALPTPTTPTSGGLQNFTASKAYYNGFFRDVPDNMWYSNNVAAVYQLGLMNGTGTSTFAPQSNVTIAEAVTLAARLHSIYYTGKEMFETYDGGNWYDPYVNYARNYGIISENYNFNQPATRETFAHILAQALPAAALQPVRSEPIQFADAGSIIYAGDINLLCQAGVINGVQSGGVTNFLPQNTITRAEVSAIVTRMAQPALRVS